MVKFMEVVKDKFVTSLQLIINWTTKSYFCFRIPSVTWTSIRPAIVNYVLSVLQFVIDDIYELRNGFDRIYYQQPMVGAFQQISGISTQHRSSNGHRPHHRYNSWNFGCSCRKKRHASRGPVYPYLQLIFFTLLQFG